MRASGIIVNVPVGDWEGVKMRWSLFLTALVHRNAFYTT